MNTVQIDTVNAQGAQYHAYCVIRSSKSENAISSQLQRFEDEANRRSWIFHNSPIVVDGPCRASNKGVSIKEFVLAARSLMPNPVLMVSSIDRLSREDGDRAVTVLREILAAGFAVYFVDYDLMFESRADLNDFAKRVHLLHAIAQSHSSSRRQSILIRQALTRRLEEAREGRFVRLGRIVPPWIAPLANTYVLNGNAVLARLVVDSYLMTRSIAATCKLLNQRSIPPFNAHRWNAKAVKAIIRNRALMGEVTISGESVESYFPALLTVDEWARLQVLLRGN